MRATLTGDRAEAADPPVASPLRDRGRWRRFAPLLVALPPMLWMASSVLRGGPLPFYDYWNMAAAVFQPDGGIDLGALLTFQNEHPVVIPDLLYWVNARVTGGSNVTLGFVILLVVFAQVVVLSRFLDERDRTSAVGVGLTAAAGVLLFSRQGAHLFFAAYSAQIANLFALGAILARSRGRVAAAIGLGIGASLCNAAGLAVWPALVVTGMVRDRTRRPHPGVVAYGVLLGVGYLLLKNPGTVFRPSIGSAIRSVASVLGAVLTSSIGVSQVLGIGILVGGAALLIHGVRHDRPGLAPWAGLFSYALVAAVLIGTARWRAVLTIGLESRYTSVSALAVLSLLGLLAVTFACRRAVLAPILVVILVSLPLGGGEVQRFLDRRPDQEELAAALRLDLAEGFTYLPYYGYPRVAPVLEGFGHYPFDGDWHGDCGLSGARPDPSAVTAPTDGTVERARLTDTERGVRVFGWVPEAVQSEVDCVLVIDPAGVVVGSGALGVDAVTYPAGPDRSFAGVAPAGASSYGVLIVLEDGEILALSGRVVPPEPD